MVKILKINFSEKLPSYCEPCNSLGVYFNVSDHKGNVIYLYTMSALVCQKNQWHLSICYLIAMRKTKFLNCTLSAIEAKYVADPFCFKDALYQICMQRSYIGIIVVTMET